MSMTARPPATKSTPSYQGVFLNYSIFSFQIPLLAILSAGNYLILSKLLLTTMVLSLKLGGFLSQATKIDYNVVRHTCSGGRSIGAGG